MSTALPPVEVAADPEAPAASRAKLVLRGLAGMVVAIGVAALAGYLAGVNPREVLGSLAGVPLWAILACAASPFVMIAFQALRWHGIMGPMLGLRYGQAYRAQAVGVMFNAIIPFRGGDLLRVQYLGRRTGKSRAAILGTEIVDRWLDFWGWIPVILVLSVISDVPRWVFYAVGAFAALLITWAIAMLTLTRRGYVPKPGSKFGEVYQSLQGGIQAFRQRRTWMLAAFVAPLPWLWEALVVSQTTRAFGVHIGVTQAACTIVGWNLSMVIPSPGAVGTMEAAGAAVMVLFGADKAQAVAFMIVYHLAQLLPGVIMGVLILVAEGESLVGKAAVKKAEGDAPAVGAAD